MDKDTNTWELLKIQRSRRTSAEMRERTEVRDRVSNEVQRRDWKNLEVPTLHTAFPLKDPYGALNMPVYYTAAYEFENAQDMENAFTGKVSAFVYSRLGNPTVAYFENRIKAITGAQNVLAFNSGMAAISGTIIALARSGSNIVASPHLFGNTYSFFASTLKAFGLEVRFCDLTDIDAVEACMDKNTCAVFLEIITNPQMEVAPLRLLSSLCRKFAVPLVADTTIIPFTHFKAADFGVDIEVLSSTKYISGGATSLGGVVIDYGTFDGREGGDRGGNMSDGKTDFFKKLSCEVYRNLGSFMPPETAHLQTTGLETTALRYEKSARNCKELAQRLDRVVGVEDGSGHRVVVSVNYPTLEGTKFEQISKQQFGELAGSMFTIDFLTKQEAYRFIDNLKLIRRATNLFDNKSLAIHPASTIFGTLSEQARREMAVKDTTVRISVGLEDVEDLYEDIMQAFGE